MNSEYVVLKKGQDTKYIDKNSKLLEILKKDGWKFDGDDDLEALRAQAEELGLKPHHKAGADKIKEMIAAKEAE